MVLGQSLKRFSLEGPLRPSPSQLDSQMRAHQENRHVDSLAPQMLRGPAAILFTIARDTFVAMVSQNSFLGEAKPGGFQTGGFPTLFGKGPDCVADPFGTFLVGALNRPRKRSSHRARNPEKFKVTKK